MDVAKSILKGMLRGCAGCHRWIPTVLFAYDEDAFRQGWNDLGFYRTEPWAADESDMYGPRAEVSWCRQDIAENEEAGALLLLKSSDTQQLVFEKHCDDWERMAQHEKIANERESRKKRRAKLCFINEAVMQHALGPSFLSSNQGHTRRSERHRALAYGTMEKGTNLLRTGTPELLNDGMSVQPGGTCAAVALPEQRICTVAQAAKEHGS